MSKEVMLLMNWAEKVRTDLINFVHCLVAFFTPRWPKFTVVP